MVIAVIVSGCAAGAASVEQVKSLSQGMTEKQVVEKLGDPYSINRGDYGDYETTQFVYKRKGLSSNRMYIYFEDHRLESVQY